MQESLPLFACHLGVCIAEDEADCGEEVTLAGAIASNNDIRAGGEGLYDGLILVAARVLARKHREAPLPRSGLPFEALNDDLFNKHRIDRGY